MISFRNWPSISIVFLNSCLRVRKRTTMVTHKMRGPPGFSLLEVMIAVAILGLVAISFTQLNVDAFKSQASVRLNSDFQSLVSLGRLSMENGTACKVNFSGLTFPSNPRTNFVVA